MLTCKSIFFTTALCILCTDFCCACDTAAKDEFSSLARYFLRPDKDLVRELKEKGSTENINIFALQVEGDGSKSTGDSGASQGGAIAPAKISKGPTGPTGPAGK